MTTFLCKEKKDAAALGQYEEMEEPNANADQGKIKIKSIVLSLPIATPTMEEKSHF